MPAHPPDRFEVTRDCRSRYLQRLGTLLQAAGGLSAAAVQALLDGVGQHFDAMLESNRRGSFSEEAHGLTSSRITLVADDELELGIRLDNLIGRLYEGAGADLWKTHLRFVTLLGRPDLPKTDNPIGPRGISDGLHAMFQAAGPSPLDDRLDLLDRLEEHLLDGLPAVYAEINDFLEHAGVFAAQPAIITAPEAARGHRGDAAPVATNALDALHARLLARIPQLEAPSVDGSGSNPGAALLSQAALDNLLFRLDDLERHAAGRSGSLGGTSPDLESLLPDLFSNTEGSAQAAPAPRQLSSRELGIPAAAAEALAIDTVAMICNAILADPMLPEAFKSVVSTLQIPLVKVAISDRSLFADPDHPCRRIIDRMGEAMIGLPIDVTARHPVCSRLGSIAAGLRTSRNVDRAAFAAALAELDGVIAERHAAIAQGATAYADLFAVLDRRDQARDEVGRLYQRLPLAGEPPAIRDFLENVWRPLLEQIWLGEGSQGAAWPLHVRTLETLLWSFQPKTDGEERKALARELPGVLKVLKAGMERMKLAPGEQESVLDACFDRQRDAIRRPSPGSTPDNAAAPVPPPPKRAPRPISTETLKSGSLILHTLDITGAGAATTANCSIGSWLELSVAGQRQALRVCQQSSSSGRSLLFNPEIPLAMAIHPQLLEQQLRAGEATILGGRSLFDAAATQALRENGS